MPGGDTRSVTYHSPYPAFVTDADGAKLYTADGTKLIDFLNNYTQSVLDHAPPGVVEVVCERFQRGNGFAAPNEEAVELANRLANRIPSVESVRFCNSGTEATMNAIRAAIAATDRESILKVVSGYHRTHDVVEVAVSGPGREHRGIPKSAAERVETVPYNDPETLKERFDAVGDELACFILEPVLSVGGMIPATTEYLQTARYLTQTDDVVLVFDEVMTFRLAPGGAQQRYGVTPDLTALGKLVGGGLPVGAFGGREDLMAVFDPESGVADHSGTFNANPATMAGGVATLDALTEDVIENLNERGETLRSRLETMVAEFDATLQVTGDGSLFQLHRTDDEVSDWESSTAGHERMEPLFHAMCEEGFFIAPRGMWNLSTAIGDRELEGFLGAFQRVVDDFAAGQ